MFPLDSVELKVTGDGVKGFSRGGLRHLGVD